MFKVGQKVWDAMFGPGVVTRSLTNDSSFPVGVRFDDDLGVESFTLDGKYRTCVKQTLFPYPVEIVKKVTKPSIDWRHIRSEYQYLAQDANGNAWLFWEKPETSFDCCWYATQGMCAEAESHVSYVPGICDWKESLIKRPELVQEI